MKTIEVFILQQRIDGSEEPNDWWWANSGLTTSLQEAKEWFARGNDYDFEQLKLNIPQEIQVQRDY